MLHMFTALKGYHIKATDGDAGHVDDFLVDENCHMRHPVVDTSNWVGGKAVLIPPTVVSKIDSPNKHIYVTMTRDQIAAAPSVDTANIELIETLPPALI